MTLRFARCLCVAPIALFLAAAATAAAPEADTEERIKQLETTVAILMDEIANLRTQAVLPFQGELESEHGLGPAASKVYHRESGVSIGGYGEVRLRSFVSDSSGKQNVFDALRGVLYIGYKFNEHIVYNSELEFEHAGTGGSGSVGVEFMTLDFLLNDAVNARVGLVLIPMGFINEIHEPVFYFGAARPEVERSIIPSTWRENGAGLFGKIGDRVSYRVYGVNGFDATGFSSAGLRGGRQKGSKALADHFAFVGRLDVEPFDGFLFGASLYIGKSGQNQIDATSLLPIPDTRTTIWELHGQYRGHGASVRALYTQAYVDDAGQLSIARGLGANKSVAKRMVGGYVEFAYDVVGLFWPDCNWSLEPFYRYEMLDTQDRVASGFVGNGNFDRDYHVVGFNFKPHSQVVIKIDYRNISAASGSVADEVQAGIGFVF